VAAIQLCQLTVRRAIIRAIIPARADSLIIMLLDPDGFTKIFVYNEV
jgi:hypothetical protein